MGYESLKNVGLAIIQNKQLKKDIIRLFEEIYEEPRARMNRAGKTYTDFIRLGQQYFLQKENYCLEPIDFKSLVKDKYFYNSLFTINETRNSRG